MSFHVNADCVFLGKSTYPRSNNQVGTQVHLLSGMDSVKVACDAELFQKCPPDGTKCNVQLDFLTTKKGNFLKALSINPINEVAK